MLHQHRITRVVQFKTNKVIYRRYAGLYFSLCVDVTDNELAYLESIHLFVEILDHYFSNVCELDLVFNFHKACKLATCSQSVHACTASSLFPFMPPAYALLSAACCDGTVVENCRYSCCLACYAGVPHPG